MLDALQMVNLNFVLYVGIGSCLGLLVGFLPGLSAITGVALLVSITLTWPIEEAMAMIMGVYVVACFAGAISAILTNIPGAPASVATTFDGYPLARKGKAKEAIFAATIGSAFGTLFSLIVLSVVARPLSKIALYFYPIDYFWLAVFGLTIAGSLASKNMKKGLICATIGVLLSCVGIDPITGYIRFAFGKTALMKGIPTIPVIVGLFGLSEVLTQISEKDVGATIAEIGQSRLGIYELLKHGRIALQSAIIGLLVGVLPGTGAPVASLLAYDSAKKTVKKPSAPFGEGAIEGIIASEAANNAVVGGALIPMLTLGIPGDAVVAIILSVFYIHGVQTGPLLFMETPHLFNSILIAGILGSFFLVLLGLTTAPLLAKVTSVPKRILMPIILVLCVIGAYATEMSTSDVLLMIVFGFVGYIMRKKGYPPATLVLGLVLGQLMDVNFRRALMLSASENYSLLHMIFTRPISLILIFGTVLSILSNTEWAKKGIMRARGIST